MPVARSNSREPDDDLPDPQLNPLINPRLGKNLGRWASVYYTTPPEKRNEAVLELVRELEGSPESKKPADKELEPRTTRESAPEQDFRDEDGSGSQHFCFMCGTPVKKGKCEQRHEHADTPRVMFGPGPATEKVLRRPWLGVRERAEVVSYKKGSAKSHFIIVLLLSALLTAWSVQQKDPAPTPGTSRSGQQAALSPQTGRAAATNASITPAAPATPVAVKATVEPPRIVPKQVIPRPSPLARKPQAGKPVECSNDALRNCPASELYRRTMTLAEGIDALFVNYDKRMSQLTKDAARHSHETARQRQSRLRQANFSAQVWENVQLASYVSHEKSVALRYRGELARRVHGERDNKKRVGAYEHPQSCLDLHYVAEDLRRLAGKLPRAQVVTRAALNREVPHAVQQR